MQKELRSEGVDGDIWCGVWEGVCNRSRFGHGFCIKSATLTEIKTGGPASYTYNTEVNEEEAVVSASGDKFVHSKCCCWQLLCNLFCFWMRVLAM